LVALAIVLWAPAFAEVFNHFGTDISILDKVFMRWRFAFLLLPLAVAALWRWVYRAPPYWARHSWRCTCRSSSWPREMPLARACPAVIDRRRGLR
jgi:hypothetical protein